MKRIQIVGTLTLCLGVCFIISACQTDELDKAKYSTETISSAEASAFESDDTEIPNEHISLSYDDRYIMNDVVEKITTIEVTSTQAGRDEADQSVLSLDSEDPSKVVAIGCGVAEVDLKDGSTVIVEVSSAPISLILVAGQSNGEGRPSDASQLELFQEQIILNEEGQVYSSYGPSDKDGQDMYREVCWYEDTDNIGALSIQNAGKFIPVSLTDNTQNDQYNVTNVLTDAKGATGKGGLDSAFAYEWVKLTGEKVWIINAAHHGSRISSWQPGDLKTDNNFWKAVTLYQEAEKVLSEEIEAGHYTLSHKGIIWCQGENDRGTADPKYMPQFEVMCDAFVEELSGVGLFGMEKEIEFIGILMVRAAADNPMSQEDFFLTGPRRTQYFLSASAEYPIVYLASQVEEKWYSDESVAEYFQTKYGSQEDYQGALPIKSQEAAIMPATMEDVHCKIHYTQLAYNEIGVDAADNICYGLGYVESPTSNAEKLELVIEDGITVQNGNTVPIAKDEVMKFAAKVYPTYLTKEIVVETSENAQYSASGIQVLYGDSAEVTVSVGGLSTSLNFVVE